MDDIFESYKEMSCKHSRDCELFEQEDFQLRYCNGTCSKYEWNHSIFPLKVEFFSNKALEKMIEELKVTDSQVEQLRLEIELHFDVIADEIIRMGEKLKEKGETFIAPIGIRTIIKEQVKELSQPTEKKKDYFQLLLFLKKIRQEHREFSKLIKRLEK